MKFPTTTLVVLATSGQALGSWMNWFKDVIVTETATRIIQSCPCNGEVTVTPIARGQDLQIFPKPGPPFGLFGSHFPAAGRIVTKAGPIVAVYSTAGTIMTKTGIVVEPEPTYGEHGPGVTTTIWTGPQPTDDLAWVDWTLEGGKDAGSLTRTRTKFTTIYGPAPTNAERGPWADWLEPHHTKTSTSSRSSSSPSGVDPIRSSTRSSATTYGYPTSPSGSSSISVSTSSYSSSGGSASGPTGGFTFSGSSSTSNSSTSVFSSNIGGSTTPSLPFTSVSLSTLTSASSSSSVRFTGVGTTTTSSSSSNGASPVGGSTTNSSNINDSTSSSSAPVSPSSGITSSMATTLATSISNSGTPSLTTTSTSPLGSTTSSSSRLSSSTIGISTSGSSSSTTNTSFTSSITLPTTTSTISSMTTSAFSSSTLFPTTSILASTTTTVAQGAVMTDDVRSLSYNDAILEAHNVHRRNHSAADLTWSDNLATIAAQIAASCIYAHNTTAGGGSYGQNIGAGYTSTQVPVMIGDDMYNKEMPNYPLPYGVDNADTSNFNSWGHFSQIVWKGTQQVGCATQFCPDGVVNADFTQYFTVCNYYPPGNIQGAYSNVGAPLGQPITVELTD